MSKLKEITTDNFDEIINKDITMIQFSAAWCGPCKMLTPIIESLNDEITDDSITICKFDIDEGLEIAKRYGIRGVPCVILMKDGKEIDGTRLVGLNRKEDYRKMLDKLNELK